ncbi:hypothetical protein BH24DEI2_BH24DEI2_15000 [soil metagenome]
MLKRTMSRPALLKRPVLVYVALLLYTVGPVLSVVIASAVAYRYGCRLDESQAHICLVGGWDAGATLYAMSVSAWLALVTLPSGALALLGYTVLLVIFLVVSRKKRPPAT